MAREPAFQIIQTDVERWSVVTGYLRNPVGRLLKKAAGTVQQNFRNTQLPLERSPKRAAEKDVDPVERNSLTRGRRARFERLLEVNGAGFSAAILR